MIANHSHFKRVKRIKPENAPAPVYKSVPLMFLAATLVACGGGNKDATTNTTPPTATAPAPGPVPAPAPTPTPTPAPATPNPANGKVLWTQSLGKNGAACANCHGGAPTTNMSKIWNASGTSADSGNPQAIGTGINNDSGGMSTFSAVSAANLIDIAAYVNAVRYAKPVVAPPPTGTGVPPVPVPPPVPAPTPAAISKPEAARLLAQASFGATAMETERAAAQGYSAWIDEQFTRPQTLHRTWMDQRLAVAQAATPPQNIGPNQFYESFWRQAITGQDHLRQRVAFALSEIFVVSFQDGNVANYPRGVASYYDVLASNAFGNYRAMLEEITLHPMMGNYLTMLRNRKEEGTRVPDENYAREIMQLFSIGLYELNADGTQKIVNGQPVETYTSADIQGLAKVFTGWSWAGPDATDSRFSGGSASTAPDRDWQPMQPYPKYHSISEKKFLGVTIPAQTTADPRADLKIALDRLATHPNTAPFISRLLIQRLITSNPTPAYVGRVSAVFKSTNGDLKAVVKAILMDSEARDAANLSNPQFGKLREPVLRMANWLRAFNAKSDSGYYMLGNTDDQLNGLSQTPMRSPTVFNFFRPGFVPPNTSFATANLAAPEMQITAETTVVGYLNTMRNAVPSGVGGRATGATRNDIQPDYSAEIALADDANLDALMERINLLLTNGRLPAATVTTIRDAAKSIAIPAATATNTAAVDTAKRNRVLTAVFLTLASPDFIAQK
jgi:uncharacterized protein (DUF1800 family)